MTISFQPANAKLEVLEKATGKKLYAVSLLSGWTCPFAEDCLSKVRTIGGKRKLVDGPKTQFRCFSASQEVQYTNVFNDRLANSLELRGLSRAELFEQIMDSLPDNAEIVRIHVAGDFFNPNYFLAWLDVANECPDVIFYAYTKSLTYWVDNKDYVDETPNFVLTASYGGRRDDLIEKHSLRYAKVVFSVEEAKTLGLEIDHDDSHAMHPHLQDDSFALLIHGIQPKDSEASQAVKLLKGKGSYSRKKNRKAK